MVKLLINKNLKYNFLSLLNIFLGFLFILYLGRKFGASEETDAYFLSMTVVTYLGYFIQAFWEAMGPYYVEYKSESRELSSELYSILLNDVVIVSFLIILAYFIVTNYFNIFPPQKKDFLDVFIFYIIFQNILFLNKTVLNLEHFYASFYIVDIFVYFVLLLVVYFIESKYDIILLAYATILSTFLANLYQFYLIFKRVGIEYRFNFFNSKFKEIYKNSIKLKIGSIFYGSKDILIASVFTSLGEGMYSLYSYANKFAGVILQVVNAPIVNVFATKANYHVVNKEFNLLKQNIKKVLLQTTILFIISATVTYFILPFILRLLFDSKFSTQDIYIIQNIYLIMVIFYGIIVIESPFARLISIFKLFNIGLIINTFFAVICFVDYLLFKHKYITFLYVLIFAQLSNFVFAYFTYKYYVRKNNEI